MKILSIGNSFSTDAHRYLYRLAQINGIEMKTVNLSIGGCDLEAHWKNAKESNAFYDIETNADNLIEGVSIPKVLDSDKWDIITLQQASRLSGIYESTVPYLTDLAKFVSQSQPQAKLYYHQTWAYEIDTEHTGFLNYDRDQIKMYNCIKETAYKAAKDIDAAIIPVGDVIQRLRTLQDFDYKNGGFSLCRDGYHLSNDYGRFAAAATWLHTLSGKDINCESFDELNVTLIKLILDTVNNI